MAASRPHPLPRLQSLPPELLANIAPHLAPPLHALELAPQKWRATLQALEQACPPLAVAACDAVRAKTVLLAWGRRHDKIVQAGGAPEIGILYLEEYVAAMVKAPPLFPLLQGVHTVRVSISRYEDIDLSVLAGLPNLCRLSMRDCTLISSDTSTLPKRLDELELISCVANEGTVDTLFKHNPLLRIVHVSDLEMTRDSGNFYLPLESLKACEKLEFLQVSVDEDPPHNIHEADIQMFAASLVFCRPVIRTIPTPIRTHTRYVAFGHRPNWLESTVVDDVLHTAETLAAMPNLAVVTLPDFWHPTGTYAYDYSGALPVQLAVNSIINACRRRRVRLVWFDAELQIAGREERVLYEVVDAVTAMRNTAGQAGARDDDDDDYEFEEWPGSWEAYHERYGY
ncbi:hypothetical protein JCM10450v2_003323 [Rhodotorula kratochvilovae]